MYLHNDNHVESDYESDDEMMMVSLHLSALALFCSVLQGQISEHCSSVSVSVSALSLFSTKVWIKAQTFDYKQSNITRHVVLFDNVYPLLRQSLNVQRQGLLLQRVEPLAGLARENK